MKHYFQLRKIPDANQWRILRFYLIIKKTTIYTIKRMFILLFLFIYYCYIVFNNTTKKGQNYALRICA